MTCKEWWETVLVDDTGDAYDIAQKAWDAATKAERERILNVARALSESLYHDGMIEDAAGVDMLIRKLLVEIERAVESETETTRREVPPGAGGETGQDPCRPGG